ncbi:MAG TPA: phosphotransferase, partial [Chthoniobacterales bacterium]|nr:phosphotransferase [Chthoniobacterales bacterium]
RLAGQPLIPRTQTHPANPSWRRAARILDRLEPLLARIRLAGWVWRDCKPSHILVDRGTYHFIDFEHACRREEKRGTPWISPDYSRAVNCATRQPGTAEDDYALGVIAFQFLAGRFPPPTRRGRARIYHRTGCPVRLRERIERLLGDVSRHNPSPAYRAC